MALNKIDFSRGIRPEEIQENFEYLQEQISRERLNVGGYGIASGLEIETIVNENTFAVNVSDGTVIDNEGLEVFISGKTIPIELPQLDEYREAVSLSSNKTVTLRYTPYALNRRLPAQYAESYEPNVSGIVIKHYGSIYVDDYIRVRNINDKTVTVTGALYNDLEVTYSYTAKRLDVLYINNNLEIAVSKGSTSTTPSVGIPSDAKYLIAYLEINNEYVSESDPIPHADIYIKKDLRSMRNLYTTSDGTLYICGTPFDDLQIIHLTEPNNPKPNTLWLNMADNTLYCWRATDEFVYKNFITITQDFIDDIKENPLPEYTFSTYMDFMLDGDELQVYLNDYLLTKGRDYEELNDRLPSHTGHEGDKLRGNAFRLLETIERPDDYNEILMSNDTISYIIRYRDSHYMWVPVNKQSYMPIKNRKVYCTGYDNMPDDYYIFEGNNKVAYFDSDLANSLDKERIIDDNFYPYKYQYFLFDRTKDLDMHFTPYRNQLSIMINQMYLHEDQFEEITIYDLVEDRLPDSVKKAAASHFGWEDKYLFKSDSDNTFDRAGIGFKLIEPLDSGAYADKMSEPYTSIYGSNDLFVEAIVQHTINAVPVNRKLERSATFIHEDNIIVKNNFDPVVTLNNISYRYAENQLEIFVNGVKKILGVDYIEQYGYFKDETSDPIPPIEADDEYKDQDYFYRKRAAVCNKFKFLPSKEPIEGDVVTYKITTNVYSYDHINNTLDDIGHVHKTLEEYKEVTSNAAQKVDQFDETLEGLKNRVKELEIKLKEKEEEEELKEGIDISQVPKVIVTNMIKSLNHINAEITLEETKLTYSLKEFNIYKDDYINVFYHKSANGLDSYWIPGVHYTIRDIKISEGNYEGVLEVLKPETINVNDKLYITGLRISMNHYNKE